MTTKERAELANQVIDTMYPWIDREESKHHQALRECVRLAEAWDELVEFLMRWPGRVMDLNSLVIHMQQLAYPPAPDIWRDELGQVRLGGKSCK